jgi:hypothetical protein
MKYPEKAIYELIKTLASGRVYGVKAPQNATPPFIVFQRIDSDRWRSVNGASGMAQATIQIDVYDDSLYGAKDVAIQIEDTLESYRGTVYYGSDSPQESIRIAGISTQNDSDSLDQTAEPFLFRNSADYLVTYEQ